MCVSAHDSLATDRPDFLPLGLHTDNGSAGSGDREAVLCYHFDEPGIFRTTSKARERAGRKPNMVMAPRTQGTTTIF
jgi:hypothetical protein